MLSYHALLNDKIILPSALTPDLSLTSTSSDRADSAATLAITLARCEDQTML